MDGPDGPWQHGSIQPLNRSLYNPRQEAKQHGVAQWPLDML